MHLCTPSGRHPPLVTYSVSVWSYCWHRSASIQPFLTYHVTENELLWCVCSEVLCMCDLFWEHSTTFPINLETVWVVRTCYVCHDSCWISLASLVYLFWQHISTSQALYKFITKIDVCATIHLLKVVCGFARSVASCSVRSPLGVLNFP